MRLRGYMSCQAIGDKLHLERLRAEYNGAFAEWALEVQRLLALEASVRDSFAIETVRERVAEAEEAYRRSRDRLAEELQRTLEVF